MFDTLDEQIKRDEAVPAKVRVAERVAILVISIALFGALYLLVRMAA